MDSEVVEAEEEVEVAKKDGEANHLRTQEFTFTSRLFFLNTYTNYFNEKIINIFLKFKNENISIVSKNRICFFQSMHSFSAVILFTTK